jgi:hypothetical protein
MRIHRAVTIFVLMLAFSSTLYARHRSAPTVPATEIEGVIKNVSATQIVVTDSHTNDVTVNITKDTIFNSGDVPITAADLAVGDHVEIKAAMVGNALNALVVKDEKEVLEIVGVIKSVSPTELVITDAQQHDTTVELTDHTIIRHGDQMLTAGNLVVGEQVEVKAVQAGTMINALIVKVEQNEPDLLEINGTIKSASATEIVVTDAQQHDTKIEITDATIIRKDGHTAAASDLKMGDRVEVKAMVNGTTTTAVMINDEAEAQEEPAEDVEVSGTVSATGSNSITVTTRNGDVVVNVDANTRIRKDDQQIGVADIKTGDQVKAEGTRVDSHTILAREIEVESSGGHH